MVRNSSGTRQPLATKVDRELLRNCITGEQYPRHVAGNGPGKKGDPAEKLVEREIWSHTREINGAIVVGVHLIDHVLQLRLAGILAEGAHDSSQFFGGNLTIAILVLLFLGDCNVSLTLSFLIRNCGGRWVLRREKRLP